MNQQREIIALDRQGTQQQRPKSPTVTPPGMRVNHHHHHQSLNREGRWGTADDFATGFLHFSMVSTALWDLPSSRPVHSLMLSSHLFLQLSADQLHHLLQELVDQHAPASRHKVSDRPPSPWFSSWEPSFLRRRVNYGELKGSGSSRDCSFTNKYFVLPTNLSTILCIKPKYISTAPKFLQAIHPGSFSASQTLFSAKSNPHRYPRPFLSLNFHRAFLTSFTVKSQS